MSEELNEEQEIVQLVDEDGNELNFAWEMSIEYKDATYAILSPAEEIEGFEEDSAVIFKLTGDEENPMLEPLEDDDLYEEVYQEYINILDEEDTVAEDEE